MQFTLTPHAKKRIEQRGIPVPDSGMNMKPAGKKTRRIILELCLKSGIQFDKIYWTYRMDTSECRKIVVYVCTLVDVGSYLVITAFILNSVTNHQKDMASNNSIQINQSREAEFILKKNQQEQKYMDAYYSIPENQRVAFSNVTYGQLVQVNVPGGRITSVKVHFFNKRGVLVGNIYEFVPYTRLRLHEKGKIFSRKFYKKPFEKIRQFGYETLCRITSMLIRLTQFE